MQLISIGQNVAGLQIVKKTREAVTCFEWGPIRPSDIGLVDKCQETQDMRREQSGEGRCTFEDIFM